VSCLPRAAAARWLGARRRGALALPWAAAAPALIQATPPRRALAKLLAADCVDVAGFMAPALDALSAHQLAAKGEGGRRRGRLLPAAQPGSPRRSALQLPGGASAFAGGACCAAAAAAARPPLAPLAPLAPGSGPSC
jgi:hypothetical protein